MCELLALNSNTPAPIAFEFTGFSARGGRTGEHVDGFGLAFHQDAGCRVFRDAGRASDAALAHWLRRTPIHATTTLAHIRKATQGRVALENTHPFQRELWGRTWVFAHNGDLKGYAPRLHAGFRPVGDTDSERAFCWLMQELAKAHASVPPVDELTLTLAELLPQIARHGTCNVLLSNGQALWAHASTRPGSPGLHWLQRSHPFRAATLADADLTVDFAPLTTPDDRVVVVATEPLTADEPWLALAAGEMKVFRGGAPYGPGALQR